MSFSILKHCICFIILFASQKSYCQLLAFPTAEGAGKYVTGGRGTVVTAPKVFEVTTLIDDASSATTPGTLRYACTNNSPAAPNRIIVFRVAGTIHLYATLTLTRANTTIAGQTAPGDGICIADHSVYVGANNMIIRYLRFRLGDRFQAAVLGIDDAFGDNGNGRQNIIIDHCTMSWSNDEAFTFYKGDNVTLQWNMISEPLDHSYHDEGTGIQNHAYGGIWGGKRASFHHNLLAHCRGRMPRFDGIRNIAADTGDFRNNVIYNWGDYNVNGGEGGTYNIVNNYYKYGPSTPNTSSSGVNRRSMLLNPYKQAAPVLPYGKYYLTGNYSDNSATVTANNWLGAAFSGGSFNDSTNSQVATAFNCTYINMQSAQDAYTSVLANAGCILPHRDTLDQRIINDVINRTGRLIDVQGGFAVGTTYSTSQVAWPELAAGTTPVDTDHDGMPDTWETKRGLNPNSAADANGYVSTSGYSNLENYLNGDTIVAKGMLNTCISTKNIFAVASGSWLDAKDSSFSGYLSTQYLSSVDTMNLVASVLDNANFGTLSVAYFTTGTQRYDNYSQPYLNRNISITAADPLLITSPVTVRFYFSKAEYDAFKIADPSINSLADLRIIQADNNGCVTSFAGSYTLINPSAGAAYGTYQDGYYLEFTTTKLGSFFITSAAAAVALPLQLISFNASLQQEIVKLNWRTTNEINVNHYQVQRSADTRLFTSIGNVNSMNSTVQYDYSFDDLSPLSGKSWYRLKMIDNNGTFTYSNLISVNNNRLGLLKVNPNPVITAIIVTHPKSTSTAFLKVVSADGKTVLNQQVKINTSETKINVAALAKGIYQLEYTSGLSGMQVQFFKQ
ncbi:MAG: T9SS type A sorting domain-containing protein [Ferruginibacter sp.]